MAQAFPSSLLTALGHSFMREFLGSFSRQPGASAYVCLYDRRVVGFVVGCDDTRRHRRTFLRQRWAFLALCCLSRAVLSPSLVSKLFRYVRPHVAPKRLLRRLVRRRRTREAVPPASLVLLGVLPEHRRQGVADRLTRAFLQDLARRGVDRVKLAVAIDNLPAVRFYLTRGWSIAGGQLGPNGSAVYRLVYQLPG